MSRLNIFFALCACLVSIGVRSAEAQSVSLVGSTLMVEGSEAADTLQVFPGVAGTGYSVRINGFLTGDGNTALFSANVVDTIVILGAGGHDDIFLKPNDSGETLLDVDPDLIVIISGDAGADEIDTGITGFGSQVYVYGGANNDTMHSYYYELNGRRIFLSPRLHDYQIGDRIIQHRIGGSPLSIRRF